MSKTTKHNTTCSMAFGRPSAHGDCPRCEELKAGSAPRAGWQKAHYARKAADAAMTARAMAAHFAPGGCKCGPVCTAFDW